LQVPFVSGSLDIGLLVCYDGADNNERKKAKSKKLFWSCSSVRLGWVGLGWVFSFSEEKSRASVALPQLDGVVGSVRFQGEVKDYQHLRSRRPSIFRQFIASILCLSLLVFVLLYSDRCAKVETKKESETV